MLLRGFRVRRTSRLGSGQYIQVFLACSVDRCKWNRLIECHESSSIRKGQCEEVDVCNLSSASYELRKKNAGSKRDRITPERVIRRRRGVPKPPRDFGDGCAESKRFFRENSNAAIQRDWTGCPAIPSIFREPLMSNRMEWVACTLKETSTFTSSKDCINRRHARSSKFVDLDRVLQDFFRHKPQSRF